ncbi:unnamed protein product [Pleuronectes platessa]|uniref:Uncharacterized protein n=1 Tax=Pleuronectes platessa TaxID=8262 RepID=A0A9N7VEE5_PLEPL|nr:unnamed protein product [Pleuronectes platessa]
MTKDFAITEELAAMRSIKGTTTGSDLFMEVTACLDKLGLKWDKLAGYKHISSDYTLVRPNPNSILGPVVVGIFPYELGLPFKKPATGWEDATLSTDTTTMTSVRTITPTDLSRGCLGDVIVLLKEYQCAPSVLEGTVAPSLLYDLPESPDPS